MQLQKVKLNSPFVAQTLKSQKPESLNQRNHIFFSTVIERKLCKMIKRSDRQARQKLNLSTLTALY